MSFRTYAQCAKLKKKILGSLEIILVLITVFSFAMIGQRIASSREIAREEQAAADKHQPDHEVVVSELPDESLEQNLPAIQPQILDLMKENTDAVGLLHFEGSRTLYVCQTTNNSYYMNHRFDGSEDPAGMIYMDYRCTQLPRSDNLILYGHNMRDGSRFGTLQRFEKKDYLLKHPIFQLVGQYTTVDYIPFAIFHTTVLRDDSHYYPFDRINFSNKSDFQQYIIDVKSRSVLDIPLEVEYGDRLLTLVTCHSGLERGRLVIVCREVKPSDPVF